MKRSIIAFISSAFFIFNSNAQDTFSIVAADSATRQVGSAGASCVDLIAINYADASFLGDLIPNMGAINTQAAHLANNQNNARARMLAGDNPTQIITWLNNNDYTGAPDDRQYGIAGFSGNNTSAAGFTGSNCYDYKNHITGHINGIYYSIQGNIILGQQILDSMESQFRRSKGDLATRLMAALQGANVVGADSRCASNGSSSLFAFIKVSNPHDAYGSPYFKISVKTKNLDSIEPIDSLQKIFDIQHPLSITKNEVLNNEISIYPNPTNGVITIGNKNELTGESRIEIYNAVGKKIVETIIDNASTQINIGETRGLYFFHLYNGNTIVKTGKIVVL